jgi:hypothetical protein
MALQVKVIAPGGFESVAGYRRVLGLQVDFSTNTVMIGVGDYKDESWRQEHPHSYVNTDAYKLDLHPIQADQSAIKDDSGKVKIIDIEAVPSGAEFLALPVGTYVPEITAAMTLKDVLGAIAYGYAKTRAANAEAVDV